MGRFSCRIEKRITTLGWKTLVAIDEESNTIVDWTSAGQSEKEEEKRRQNLRWTMEQRGWSVRS